MIRKLISAIALAAALSTGAASAQTADPFTGFYSAGEVGYDNGEGGFDQFIVGGAVGYSVPVNAQFYVAGEGEVHWSADDFIDFTWGFTGNVGYRLDQDLAVFGRAGYREFNTDGFGSGSDYTLGLGVQYAFNDNVSFRPILDTVAFDTIGVRAGIVYSF